MAWALGVGVCPSTPMPVDCSTFLPFVLFLIDLDSLSRSLCSLRLSLAITARASCTSWRTFWLCIPRPVPSYMVSPICPAVPESDYLAVTYCFGLVCSALLTLVGTSGVSPIRLAPAKPKQVVWSAMRRTAFAACLQ